MCVFGHADLMQMCVCVCVGVCVCVCVGGGGGGCVRVCQELIDVKGV